MGNEDEPGVYIFFFRLIRLNDDVLAIPTQPLL